MIFGSVCSGVEAASLAWEPLGWRAAFLSETDPFPRSVLQHHYPLVPLHGDFTTIQADDYEPIDLLVGGTPCQDFSISGLRAGMAGERGNLTLEYLRLADRLRARWLAWENVPGVLSSNGGRDFGAFLGGLAELGYGWAYRILDAQHFGVPQRRARVILVAYLGDWRPPAAVLFERHSLRWDSPPSRGAPENAAGTLAGGARVDSGYSTDDVPLTAGALDANDGGMDENDAEQGRLIPAVSSTLGSNGKAATTGTLQDARADLLLAFGGNRQSGPLEVATTVLAHSSPARRGDFESETFITFDATQITSVTNRSRPEAGDPSPTLARGARPPHIASTVRARDGARGVDSDATDTILAFNSREDPCVYGDQSGTLGSSSPQAQTINHQTGVRRLTPLECERLQGMPDNWTRVVARRYKSQPRSKHAQRFPDLYEATPDGSWVRYAADGPRYKAIGNSMAVPVMAWVGRRIDAVEQIIAKPQLQNL